MLDTRFFTFLVLCQTKSFTKTAEELHITQPAVSHHIKYLEEYYNVKLYTYVGKKFHLTTSGEVLYQFVSSFYTDSERIKEQLRQSNSASAMLRLGAEQSAGESFLPYLIISYLEKNPDCRKLQQNFLLHKKIPAVACTTDFCGEHGSLKYT